MKPDDIEPYDWYKRFFGRGRGNFFEDIFKGFEETQREIEREFADIEKNMPKELIREYTTPEGGIVKEVGPMVYGYSMTIGPDGRPNVREFGNVKRPSGLGLRGLRPEIAGEMEPMIDVMSTEKEVKVTVEMPGVSKENIRINVYDSLVEIKSEDPRRKYHKTIDLPAEADIETAKSRYNNGILEITFEKKKETKPKGKEIKIE
jgi:HSP20 family protein